MYESSWRGNREVSGSACEWTPQVRIGNARIVASDERTREVWLRRSSCEAGEQSGAIRCGVEPRAGTKGNANQQSTRGVQNRGSVSRALDRVRKVAREKKERFTTLLRHVDVAMLETTFYALKRAAAPGMEGATMKAA
jgi:hypothetical protein